LDIGCGNGILPKIMEERGWDARGIDPYIDKQRDKLFHENVERTSLQEFETDQRFGLVTLIHTFEHMPNPKKSVAKIAKLLDEGGYLFIVVPNFGSYWSKLRGKNWRWLNTSEHRYHFTPNYIEMILRGEGYEITKVITDNKNMRGLLLENMRAKGYLKSSSLTGAVLHKGGSILDSLLKGIVDRYLDRHRKGAELIAVARRC
jgi:2-polyprenyl-3-methyl-5-hydroxy-6-metoxy-1,4-benzoquinol methylase